MVGLCKNWARRIKRDAVALALAARDLRTPWPARVVCAATAAYALSPVDPIPDGIPVRGCLDEAILLPLAILLAVRLVPPRLMAEFRVGAAACEGRPISKVAIWVTAGARSGLARAAGGLARLRSAETAKRSERRMCLRTPLADVARCPTPGARVAGFLKGEVRPLPDPHLADPSCA